MDVYVLGSREVVAALALAGLPGREIATRSELHGVLADPVVAAQTRILVLEESTARLDREEIDRMKLDAGGPLVVEIPGIRGPSGDQRTPLDLVRQALGINL